MAKDCYRVKLDNHPHFVTCTVVNWFPIFTRPPANSLSRLPPRTARRKSTPPASRGAFTYFFLKALMGEGDQNKNGWVDTLEAYWYACGKLEALGLEQNPQMSVRKAIPIIRVR